MESTVASRRKLLVVDDHEVVREGLVAMLAGQPAFEVVGTANDGRTAVEQARRTLPDIVLLDLRLPDIDGIELCRKLRKGPSEHRRRRAQHLPQRGNREGSAGGRRIGVCDEGRRLAGAEPRCRQWPAGFRRLGA